MLPREMVRGSGPWARMVYDALDPNVQMVDAGSRSLIAADLPGSRSWSADGLRGPG